MVNAIGFTLCMKVIMTFLPEMIYQSDSLTTIYGANNGNNDAATLYKYSELWTLTQWINHASEI